VPARHGRRGGCPPRSSPRPVRATSPALVGSCTGAGPSRSGVVRETELRRDRVTAQGSSAAIRNGGLQEPACVQRASTSGGAYQGFLAVALPASAECIIYPD